MKHMIIKSSKSRILAAEDDEGFFMPEDDEDIDEFDDQEVDDKEDIESDEPKLDIDNNIAGKYIAECESCKGVFISAIPESEQDIEYISGECPLCGKDTHQYLKWIIKSVDKI